MPEKEQRPPGEAGAADRLAASAEEHSSNTPESHSVELKADKGQIEQFVDALFRYASEDTFVSLRGFYDRRNGPPPIIEGVRLKLEEDGLGYLVQQATRAATMAARNVEPVVFCLPIATFDHKKKATAANLVDGLALSVECDTDAQAARERLEGLLGKATVVVASGGEWTDPATGELHPKLHLHWRLSEPANGPEAHEALRRARMLATKLIGADGSNIPLVHPIRWPGSWHRKGAPRMAEIVASTPDHEIHLDDALETLEAAAKAAGLLDVEERQTSSGPGEPCTDADLAALALAVPNEDLPWDEWNTVLMAFYAASGGSEDGLAAALAWSAKSGKDDPAETAARWAHYRTSPPSKISIGTLIHRAQQADKRFRLPSWTTDAKDEFEAFDGPQQDTGGGVHKEGRADTYRAAIDELNALTFVAALESRGVIVEESQDGEAAGKCLAFIKPADVILRYKHRHYVVGVNKKGEDIWRDLGSAWIESPRRRTYDRIELLPHGKTPPGVYNLWHGFGVEPIAGKWPLIEYHLRVVICSNIEDLFRYLLRLLAYWVQHPERRGEVAIVLKGLKGSGKGMVGQMLMLLFNSHGLQISSSKHLTGHFNAHLLDKLLLFADEAFWAGDKQGEGTLKALITERQLMVEPKGVDAFPAVNRLKIVMASNNDWVVPASADERRYFVLEVSSLHRGDLDYFVKLDEAIHGDELAAFLHDLLGMDLEGWNHRLVPHTAALNRQKVLGADSFTRYWYECLNLGEVIGIERDGWPDSVVCQELDAAHVEWARNHGEYHPLTGNWVGRRIRELSPAGVIKTFRPADAPRLRHYRIGGLAEHRRAFAAAMNAAPEDFEWLA